MKFKLTSLEKQWILYDVGNSAFTLMVSTLIPIYFNSLAETNQLSSVDYLAYWGYATSIATLMVAILGPILGTLADTRNFKKKLFVASMMIGVIGCAALGFLSYWLAFLIVFVLAKVGYSTSLIFYDSMLVDVSSPDHVDQVSSQGYAWGYIGSCIPFAACLILVLGSNVFGMSQSSAMTIAFILVALWWLLVSLPLIKNYKQKHYIELKDARNAMFHSFSRLAETLRNVKKERKIFLFLIAFFFYIDGVYTIIDMATAYGTALGLDTTGLLLALLVTQIVAFPSSITFGRLCQNHDLGTLITICIAAYTGIAVFALFMNSQWQFWVLAVCVGLFQGGIQAMSRSYFTKIIPAEKSGEYFGLMDIFGKGASFFGTTLISVMTQISGSVNIGVGSLVIVFIIGLIMFRKAYKA